MGMPWVRTGWLALLSLAVFLVAVLFGGDRSFAATTIISFPAAADAYVSQSAPTLNYGTRLVLATDGQPIMRTYIRFKVSGLVGAIRTARLRVLPARDSAAGFDVQAVPDNNWQETTINFTNAPSGSSAISVSSGSLRYAYWKTVDVTSLVRGNGTVTLALLPRDTNELRVNSRETVWYGPSLVIEMEPNTSTPSPTSADARATMTAAPSNTPTRTATRMPTATPTRTATPSPTVIPSRTPTWTTTASPTAVLTDTPTKTATVTLTAEASKTPTQTATSTTTASATATPSQTATPSVTPSPTLAPAVYWGGYLSGVPWDMTLQDAFETRLGKRASIIHWGQPWIHNGVYQPFYAGDFDRVRQRGSIPLLDWGSWDYSLGPNQPNFQLADIYGGLYDAHIRNWATAAKNWGHPLFLRFDHEMNGWWQFPWAEKLNGNQPGDYVKAWRHVHDVFVSVGAANVTWVWCPNIVGDQTTPLTGLYPGDGYVDWVCMDGYNFGTNSGNAWQTFAQVVGRTYGELGQLAPAKPIMIGEIASSEEGGSKAEWITDALSVQMPANFPRIKALVWFNWNPGAPPPDWRIESSAASQSAFAAALASGYYAGAGFADLAPVPIPALR